MNLLLDTHIWLWYALGDSTLSKSLEKLISSETTKLWISPISMWEIIILAHKGKIRLDQDAATWVRTSLALLDLHEAPINGEIAILSRQLVLPHQDPADRFIAATAVQYGFPLATIDNHLVEADWLLTIS